MKNKEAQYNELGHLETDDQVDGGNTVIDGVPHKIELDARGVYVKHVPLKKGTAVQAPSAMDTAVERGLREEVTAMREELSGFGGKPSTRKVETMEAPALVTEIKSLRTTLAPFREKAFQAAVDVAAQKKADDQAAGGAKA